MPNLANAILLEVSYQHWIVWMRYVSRPRYELTRKGFLSDMASRHGIDAVYACTPPLSPFVRDELRTWAVDADPATAIPARIKKRGILVKE